MGGPSTSTRKLLNPAANCVAQARSPVKSNPSPAQKPFPTGKKSICPGGIVQTLTTVPAPKTPARNQTWPVCPTPQLAPVVSRSGFLATGGSYAHLTQRALHSPYVRPCGAEFGGRTPGL